MRSLSALLLTFVSTVNATADDGLIHRWQFDADHLKDKNFKAVAGPLDATLIGLERFDTDKPKALILDGDAKSRHRIEVTADLANAGLPAKSLTVEAWVRIDKPAATGGIVGLVGGNGANQKGWILGYNNAQFSFGLTGKGSNKFVLVKSRTTFQLGCWYHVVGSYDGTEVRIYIDGKLLGHSKEQSGEIVYPALGVYTIGAYQNDKQLVPLAGQLAEVSVFSKALAGADVAGRFDGRKGLFPDVEIVHPTVTDWPTYLRDNRRTGISTENLNLPLRLAWVHKPRFAPAPAWPLEAKNDYWNQKYDMADRVTYDRAFHMVGVGDRVYFGSSADDQVRCLDADTGRLRWSFFAEGPVRLAPTIVEDRVLFGSDDGFVYCLAARDGSLLWKELLAPDPRRIPGNGRMISAWPVRTDVLVDGITAHVCAGIFPSQGAYQVALNVHDGKLPERQALGVTPQGYLERDAGKLHVTTGRNPAGAFVSKLKRLGKEVGKEVSSLPADYPFAFVGAGEVRFGGGDGKIAAFKLEDGSKVWSATVEGKVYSLAVVRGRLLASTDKGQIYCFTTDATEVKTIEPPAPVEFTYPDVATKDKYVALAERIIKESSITKGYCLVLGSGEGRLAYELAKRTQLQVIGREPDADKVARSRRALDAAGLSGRVAIHHGTLDELPYSDYTFNLIVGDSLVDGGKLPGNRAEVLRISRPLGGIAILGFQGNDIIRRAPLLGAGEWSHMYADAGNTACSNDERVTGPLAIQWFGEPGARGMIDRHHRTVAPLSKDGRLFVPGEDRVTAVDAYNGTILWEGEFPGSRRVTVFRDCSYLAVGTEHLYVAAPEQCLALNPQTGKRERVFPVPAGPNDQKQEWGYVAVVGDVLLGSAVKPGSSRRAQSRKIDETETYYDFVPTVCSDFLFGLDRRTGKELWTYRPESGLIVNATIAAADGAVFFIESTNPETMKKPLSRATLGELFGKGSNLVALDLKTGKTLWRRDAKCAALQHNVYLCAAQGKVIIVGSRNSGTGKKKDTVFYDIHVFDAKSGEPKWSQSQDSKLAIGGDHGEQDQHPVIVGDKLYCEPFAYNLHTGARLEFKWPWAGRKRSGCGNISASASTFFFRDGTVGSYDLASEKAKSVTSETRPGCWINLIPAGGLLLAPEASSGCSCNAFSVQTSLALIPVSAPLKK